MKTWIFTGVCVLCSFVLRAQGSLQFNQVRLISNNLETVPANKVWKITAVYGQKFACVPMSCPGSWPNNSIFTTRSGFRINGVDVTTFNAPFQATSGIYYENTSCSGAQSTGNPTRNCLVAGYGDIINPIPERQTLLPLWLPAGATVQSFEPEIRLSVLEFNIIP